MSSTTQTSLDRIMDAAAAYEADETGDWAIREAFDAAVIAAIREAIQPLGWEIVCVDGSIGSSYCDIYRPGDDDTDTYCVRISNHPRGNSGESSPIWSFEVGDSAEQHRRGVAAVVSAINA